MSGVTKLFGFYKLSKWMTIQNGSRIFHFLLLCTYAYLVDLKYLAKCFSLPRVCYYLKLMQVGDHLRLGEDTLTVIKFAQEGGKDLSKLNSELLFLHKYSLNQVITYH